MGDYDCMIVVKIVAGTSEAERQLMRAALSDPLRAFEVQQDEGRAIDVVGLLAGMGGRKSCVAEGGFPRAEG